MQSGNDRLLREIGNVVTHYERDGEAECKNDIESRKICSRYLRRC